jgi:hypothetical protein
VGAYGKEGCTSRVLGLILLDQDMSCRSHERIQKSNQAGPGAPAPGSCKCGGNAGFERGSEKRAAAIVGQDTDGTRAWVDSAACVAP